MYIIPRNTQTTVTGPAGLMSVVRGWVVRRPPVGRDGHSFSKLIVGTNINSRGSRSREFIVSSETLRRPEGLPVSFLSLERIDLILVDVWTELPEKSRGDWTRIGSREVSHERSVRQIPDNDRLLLYSFFNSHLQIVGNTIKTVTTVSVRVPTSQGE